MKKDIIIVGVGGQGILLASRVLGKLALEAGLDIKVSEVHGMSQRGGSVASHVRAASDDAALPSSLIESAGADLVLSFEPGEALRAYGRLKPSGALVCANRAVVPASSSNYDGSAQLDWLHATVDSQRLAIVDTSVLEQESLSPKCLNVMLLGAAIGLGALPFDSEALLAAMKELMRPNLVLMNEKALELGTKLAIQR